MTQNSLLLSVTLSLTPFIPVLLSLISPLTSVLDRLFYYSGGFFLGDSIPLRQELSLEGEGVNALGYVTIKFT